jgi:hypothetical protein
MPDLAPIYSRLEDANAGGDACTSDAGSSAAAGVHHCIEKSLEETTALLPMSGETIPAALGWVRLRSWDSPLEQDGSMESRPGRNERVELPSQSTTQQL